MALMPPKDIHNPKRWRDRAAEIRALAESATDAETRHNVIHLADGWGLALAQCIWASAGEGAVGAPDRSRRYRLLAGVPVSELGLLNAASVPDGKWSGDRRTISTTLSNSPGVSLAATS